jgi:5S rRNA maturation endonuclease (ribonuclease M5)
MSPTAVDAARAERLRAVLEALYEANKLVPVIVEGRRDADALKRLGLVGEIITLHRGESIYEFYQHIDAAYRNVILLLDWDSEGENLFRRLGRNLSGHWEEFAGFRDALKALCQKDIKDVEGIPKLLRRLEGDDGPRAVNPP